MRVTSNFKGTLARSCPWGGDGMLVVVMLAPSSAVLFMFAERPDGSCILARPRALAPVMFPSPPLGAGRVLGPISCQRHCPRGLSAQRSSGAGTSLGDQGGTAADQFP